MPKAVWNGVIIAQAKSEETHIVEGNIYFPVSALDHQWLRPSDHHTVCHWKGEASYYDLVVAGNVNENAAWYYPDPLPAAAQIRNHVAFWRGVRVEP